MNINNLILISICLILIIYYYNLNIKKNTTEAFNNKSANNFENSSDDKISLEEYLNSDLLTVYEKGLISKGIPFACSLIPHSKYFDHSYCGSNYDTNLKKIICPVHIIIDYKGTYLALFNDGLIRQKKSITDDFWNNPLNNSVANQTNNNFGSNDQIIPMRMITFDARNNLIGVGFDNKLYIKEDHSKLPDDDFKKTLYKNKNYENIWQDITPSDSNGIIYILFKQYNQNITDDLNDENDVAIVLDTNGKMHYYMYNENSPTLREISINTNLSLIKIYFDQYGYLLGLSDNFKLYRSSSQLYFDATFIDKEEENKELQNEEQNEKESNIIEQSSLMPGEILFDLGSNGEKSNPTPLIDIIYDYDSRLYGLGIFPKRKRTILMKQKNKCINCFFSSVFGFSYERDMVDFKSATQSEKVKLSKEDILKLKSGYDLGLKQIKTYPEINDINYAYQKISLNSRKKLRTYCKKYNNKNNFDSKNFNLINKMEEQEKKIDDLQKSISQMIKFDPSKKKIQEDMKVYTF